MVKIKKQKMRFWTPKRLFHAKLMKKLCSTQKVCPLVDGGQVTLECLAVTSILNNGSAHPGVVHIGGGSGGGGHLSCYVRDMDKEEYWS